MTTNKEKTEVIANLTAGNKVKFQYIKRERNYDGFPARTNYEVKNYEGTVVRVRDTDESRLTLKTVYANKSVERSRFLLTVQLSDNTIQSFYDGRVINIEEVKEVPKNFLKRTLDKIMGK